MELMMQVWRLSIPIWPFPRTLNNYYTWIRILLKYILFST